MLYELNRPRSGDKWIGGSSKTVFKGADKGFKQFTPKQSTGPSFSFRNLFVILPKYNVPFYLTPWKIPAYQAFTKSFSAIGGENAS